MKRTYPIRETNYEEVMEKRLNEFYVAVQIISFVLPLGEKCILEKSRIYMIYGIDIMRKKNHNWILHRR